MSKRALACAWASPYTALGLVVGLTMLATGGHVRRMRGTFEFSGGLLPSELARLPQRCRFSAITLGHVILGVNSHMLDTLRSHEQVHVAQYGRWGPFFIPAYLLNSAWQLCCGRCAYRDNYFEKQAFAIDGPEPTQALAWAEPVGASNRAPQEDNARQGGIARAASAIKPANASGVSTPNTSV